jgi:RimJ/RimL family protein N-acetyltransferase
MTDLLQPSTTRLLLRQWKQEDREPFARLNADPRVMEYFPSPLSCESSDALADQCETLIRERGWGVWALELKASGAFVGFVGLHVPSAELPFSPCVEIAWRLAHDYWRLGLATEAAKETIRVGFDLLKLPEIVSFTAVGNLRSRSVMERLDMQESGTFDHPQLPVNSSLRSHCLYRLSSKGRVAEQTHAASRDG